MHLGGYAFRLWSERRAGRDTQRIDDLPLWMIAQMEAIDAVVGAVRQKEKDMNKWTDLQRELYVWLDLG